MSLRMDHFRWISVFLACGVAASCGGASGGEKAAMPGAPAKPNAPETGVNKPAGNVVIPFGGGMRRPIMISGRNPVYTEEARANGVQGLMIARCVITIKGSVTNCRMIKSLPHMSAEVIAALQSRLYTPVLFRGRPVAVDYVFNIRLALPKPPPPPSPSSGAPSEPAPAPASPPP